MKTNSQINVPTFGQFIKTIFLVLFLSLSFSIRGRAAPADTIRVATTGTDTADCGSEATPCKTIQYAVDRAVSGDEILVAKGTYTYAPSDLWPTCYISSVTPPVVCIIDKKLTILGGFDGTNWFGANPKANPTIIDGQNRYRGIGVFGSNTSTPVAGLDLEGFTIKNGYAAGAAAGADWQIAGYGGGLFATYAPITLRNILFTGNRANGGNTNSAYGGAAAGGGLAISATPSGTVSNLANVTFDSNIALGGSGPERGGSSLGGGFYIYSAKVIADDILLTNNTAQGGSSSGSGVAAGLNADALGGGGVAHGDSDVTLNYLTATGNHAIGGSAGGHGGNAHGGALFAEYASILRILDANIQGNVSLGGPAQNAGISGGGGIMATNSNIDIERTKIIGNTSTGGNGSVERGSAGGGGLYFTRFGGNTSIVITNSMIADNYISMGTGPGNPGGGGGGLWLQGVQINITHSTISNNRMEPSLVYGIAAIFVNFSTPTPTVADISYTVISNHILAGTNRAALHVADKNTLNLNTGIFSNNTHDTNAGGQPTGLGVGTINGLSTMLSTASVGFISPGAPNNNYHISISSYAKDKVSAGTNLVDMDWQLRPYGLKSDIGADEYWPFGLRAVAGNQRITLDWAAGVQFLAGGVSKYSILVNCPPGANPPNEIPCDQETDVGNVTNYQLTGLSNFKWYLIMVSAKTSGGTVIATTEMAGRLPSDLIIYLPLVLK